MRPKFGVLFLSVLLCGAAQGLATVLPDACGDDKVKFDVTATKGQPAPSAPGAGLAQIVFIGTVVKENLAFCVGCDVLTRLGLDGAWVGANKGNTYFSYDVTPGVHHVCTNWDSRLAFLANKIGVASFTAEPGNVYYFQAKILMKMENLDTAQMDQRLNLVALNEDEAKYLMKISEQSTSKPHK